MQFSYLQQEVIQCDIEGCADARSLLLERIDQVAALQCARDQLRAELVFSRRLERALTAKTR